MASSSVCPAPRRGAGGPGEALLPRLRERAAATEEARRVPDETIEDFRQAGFFRLFQPARYGATSWPMA